MAIEDFLLSDLFDLVVVNFVIGIVPRHMRCIVALVNRLPYVLLKSYKRVDRSITFDVVRLLLVLFHIDLQWIPDWI
jgi:hypothetical protein